MPHGALQHELDRGLALGVGDARLLGLALPGEVAEVGELPLGALQQINLAGGLRGPWGLAGPGGGGAGAWATTSQRASGFLRRHSCINCHTILGEGAYYAPELGNVWKRWDGDTDPEGARDTFKAWMAAQPSGIPGRRQMPQFNLNDQELNDLADFLEWTSRINTQNWPPNKAG